MSRVTVWNPMRKGESLPWTAPWGDMLERFFPSNFFENGEEKWMPKVDVKETPEYFLFNAEIPGLKAEEITVNLVADTLTISGEKKKEEKKEKDQWHWTERTYGAFQRSFTFPVPVDAEHVDAEMKDGVLTVKVAKAKKVIPKKVTIQAK